MTPDELRAWRASTGLSQTGLAARLGTHSMTVSKWERGEATIPPYLHYALRAIRAELVSQLESGPAQPL